MHFSEDKLIEFTRSRPYKKNDNCHVEQKNWTHDQRLLESSHLTMGQNEELRRKYQLLNPIELREIIKRQILKLNRYKQEIDDLKLAA